jgi:FtsP/CotA-like multicopper oxidase with cupredoxin domain
VKRRAVLVLAVGAVLWTASAAQARASVRTFWIAAEPVTWNIVPNGHDAIMHESFPTSQTVFPTIVYRRYTRGWKRSLPSATPGSQPNSVIPGPLLHARVGDRIVVHFKNLDTALEQPHSMHFHGVEYRPSSDGAYVPGFSGRDADVKPGRTWTYRLRAGRHSAGVWPYHDHSPSMADSIAGGMYGTLSILGRRDRAPDREYVVYFEISHGFSMIDGRAFVGNTPVMRARVGEVVQWDVLAMGSEHHTFHVHGHRWLENGVPRDTKTLGPAESFRIRWREDAPGTWLYHCHVEQHMMHGMIGIYRVAPRR